MFLLLQRKKVQTFLRPGCRDNTCWQDFAGRPEMKNTQVDSSVARAMDRRNLVLVNFPAGDVIRLFPICS